MTLFSRTEGEKGRPALVLLHGFMGNTNDWQSLVSLLSPHFYLVLVDSPGHGKSDSIPCSGFSGFITCLEQVVVEQQLGRFSLLGYSLGARLAMAYASAHPQRLEHLFLESGHPGLLSEPEKQQRALADQRWADRFQSEPLADVLNDWYQLPVFSDISLDSRVQFIRERENQQGKSLAEAIMAYSLSAQLDFRDALKRLNCPVYYFAGERDSKYVALGQGLLEEGCINNLHIVESAGHNIHRRKPEALSAVIRGATERQP